MPAESVVALAAIVAFFTLFSVVLGWASRNAPPTFPGQKTSFSGPARSERMGQATAGAH